MRSLSVPVAITLEEDLLFGCLVDRDFCAYVCSALSREDFYQVANQRIFDVIKRVAAASDYDIDTLLVRHAISDRVLLEAFDQMSLRDTVPSFSAIEGKCRKLRQLREARALIQAATNVCALSVSPDVAADPATFLNEAGQLFLKAVQERSAEGNTRTAAELLQDIVQELITPPAEVVDDTIDAPINAVNKMLNGFEPGGFYVFAARPGNGKSAYLMQCLEIAAESGRHAVVYSLEMKQLQFARRWLAGRAQVNGMMLSKRNMPNLSVADRRKLIQTAERIADIGSRIHIVDAVGKPAEEIFRHARTMKMKGKCDLFGVDYLQLMGSEQKFGSREEMITSHSRTMKEMTGQLGAPGIALSQLSREVESRDGRPQLSDLRFSGAIEEDADAVTFLYPNKENSALSCFGIEKNRSGGTGVVHARFDRSFTRFVDLEDQVL